MSNNILGIHHVTAISGNAQENVDFYTGVLGLRLVKKTVNFDDPATYHLYFGNEDGTPGTIITFFPWSSGELKGRIGTGQLSTTSFSIPEGAMGFWMERFKKHNIDFKGPQSRFDEEVLSFRDSDGLQLELVASVNDNRSAWKRGPLPAEYAVLGFYHVSLSVEGYERTAGLLTETLEFNKVSETGNRFRYVVAGGGVGKIVDILCQPEDLPGRMGVGTVHHVAWRTPSEATQLEMRSNVAKLGYNVTPVLDRNYFKSIYFREPGHILFEIATDPPGFTVDETKEDLGKALKLPPRLEKNRMEIEKVLTPLSEPE
jgi:catechol 2,3-dioxygenase-like lactoylglutathione lyase family enzyme